MDFKVEGTCNTKKYCRWPWVAAKTNFLFLDALQWLKQPFNSFYFETLYFFSFVSLSSFCYVKTLGAMPSPPRPSRGVASPDYVISKGPHEIKFWRTWNPKMKYTNEYSSMSRWQKQSHLYSCHVYSGSFIVIKMSKNGTFSIFSMGNSEIFE